MYISTEINSYKKFGDIHAVLTLLKEAGFTAYDFSMFGKSWMQPNEFLEAEDYIEQAKALRAFADGIGIACNQSHAPFPTLVKGNEAYNEQTFPYLVRAIEVSGILGVKVVVVHPGNDHTAEENAVFYKKLEPYARKAGVKIGLENMWNWDREKGHTRAAACSHHDDFKKHLDLLPEDVFVACLDIGHAEMFRDETNAVKMIETLGERLQAIHLHDVDKTHDNHSIPFVQKVDYASVIEALKKTGYQGDITLEADTFAKGAPKELVPAAARYAAAVADYFKTQMEK